MEKTNAITQKKMIVEILRGEASAILGIPLDNPYENVINLIHKAIKKHGRVIVSGVGKAGDAGRKIVSTFNSTGIPSIFLSPLEAAHGDLGVICANDLLVLISNSGKTREILELIRLARNFHPQIPIIGLTGARRSPLLKQANIVLYTGKPKEICPFGLTPTCSTVAMLALGDILTVLSMKKRNFTPSDYYKRHHGGYLGKKAKQK